MKRVFVLFLFTFGFVWMPVSVDGAVKPANNLGIVGWWPLNEGTSTIAHDISGYGNNGTLTNMESATDWVSGKRGKALTFDGATENVIVGDPASGVLDFGTGDLSFAFWMRTTDNSGFKGLISKGATTAADPGYKVTTIQSSDRIRIDLANGSTYPISNFQPSVPVLDGVWHHIVFVGDRDVAGTIYVDGVLRGTQVFSDVASPTSISTGSVFSIGSETNSRYLIGSVDDVRVYNRAISPTEVLALYRAGQVTRQTVSQSGLVGWWTFDEGTSTRATDFSGQGNHGLLAGTGGPTWIGGRRGKALNFAGQDTNNNQTVTITAGATNPELAILGDVTVSAWIRPSSSYFDTSQAVVRAGSGADLDYSLFYDPINQRPYFHWYDGGFPNVTGTTNSVPFNQWSLVTIVRSGLTASFYVNGVFTNSAAVTAPTVAAAQIAIGRTNNVGVPQDFSGDIDDVRVYNRALSASEVLDLYRQNQTEVGGSREMSVSDGLVGYWSMNGKDIDWRSQTVYDRSGYGNNAVTVNMSTTTSPTQGKMGQGLLFNGTNNYMTAPDSNSLDIALAGEVTIAGWIKRTVDAGGYETIITKRGAGTNYELSLNTTSTGGSKGLIFYSGGGITVSTTLIPVGVWTHVATVTNASVTTYYVNGVAAGTTTAVAGSPNTDVLSIGRTGSQYLRGSIDELRLYNRALSASEIKRLYNLGR